MTHCAICGFTITVYHDTSDDGCMHAYCARRQTSQPIIRLMLADRHDAPRPQPSPPPSVDVRRADG